MGGGYVTARYANPFVVASPPLRWALVVGAVLLLVLVPFALVGASADRWALDLVAALQQRPAAMAGAVVALLALDVVAPVPSSVVATLAGAALGIAAGALASFAGLTLGCAIGYALGRTAGRGAAQVTLGEREVERLEAGWARFGDAFLILARAVPVLAEASVLFAGMSAMPRGRFLLLTGLANAGLSLVYASVGAWTLETPSFLLAFGCAVALPAAALLAASRLRPA